MISRLFAIAVVVYALGFAVFAIALPQPLDAGVHTDALVVPTGGAGRIDRGIALLRAHAADRMLVTGVAPGVRSADLAREYQVPMAVFRCCVDLGREAVDTRSNAIETAQWVREHHYRSVRLVTSDWHLPRAKMELSAVLDQDVALRGDGVPTTPNLSQLLREYNKLLLRRVALWLGLGT